MTKPSERSIEIAAQCWCDPRTENTVMDTVLATVFAERLDAELADLRRKAAAWDWFKDHAPDNLKSIVVEIERLVQIRMADAPLAAVEAAMKGARK